MNREACKELCAAPGGGYNCKAGPFGYCSQGEAIHGRREAPPRKSAKQRCHKAQRLLAFVQGESFALAGLPRDTNPHAEGSALWLSWNAGWKEGG